MDSNLYALVTVKEAAQMYYRAASTIKYHIDRGNLTWRKVEGGRGGLYLITLTSLIHLYGKPHRLPSELVQNSQFNS